MDANDSAGVLLAVDVGLRTGLALFDARGRLVFARSHNYGAPARLKGHVPGLLRELPGLERLVLEGGRPLVTLWEKQGAKAGLGVRTVSAETWRADLLRPAERISGEAAKQAAVRLAWSIIRRIGAKAPASLAVDAAEAVCLGWWALGGRRDAVSGF